MIHRGGWPFATTKLRAREATAEARHQRYEQLWAEGGMHLIINSYRGVLSSEELNNEISEFVRGKIRETVKDPETARKLMPNYFIGTKRMILDNGYSRPITGRTCPSWICGKTPSRPLRKSDSDPRRRASHRYARAGHGLRRGQRSMLAINPKGRGGLSLKEKWGERFETYLGATIAGFLTSS